MPTTQELGTPEWWMNVENLHALHRLRHTGGTNAGCPIGSCQSRCLWHQYRVQYARDYCSAHPGNGDTRVSYQDRVQYARDYCSARPGDNNAQVPQLSAIFTAFKASLLVPVTEHHWTPAEISSWLSHSDRTTDDLARPLVKLYEHFLAENGGRVPDAITGFFNLYREGVMNRPPHQMDLIIYLLDNTMLLSEIANRGG